jgi:hypothetical protein
MVGPSLAVFTVRGAVTSFPKFDGFDPPSTLLVTWLEDEPELSDPKGGMRSFDGLVSSTAVGAGGASTPSA